MKKRILLVLLVVAATVALLAQKLPTGGPDPLVVASDTHKLVFENKFVRVIESRVPPGGKEPTHYHPHGVTIYLADFRVKVSENGKAPVERERKAGTAVWAEAVVHEINNIGTTEGHAFRVELKM